MWDYTVLVENSVHSYQPKWSKKGGDSPVFHRKWSTVAISGAFRHQWLRKVLRGECPVITGVRTKNLRFLV